MAHGGGDGALTIERVVLAEIERLLRESGRATTELHAEDRLAEVGITSLDVADLIAALNARLGADPFRHLIAFTELQTVADVCRAYRRDGEPAERRLPPELEESRQRALTRRAARRE
jgi:hypothetical protein